MNRLFYNKNVGFSSFQNRAPYALNFIPSLVGDGSPPSNTIGITGLVTGFGGSVNNTTTKTIQSATPVITQGVAPFSYSWTWVTGFVDIATSARYLDISGDSSNTRAFFSGYTDCNNPYVEATFNLKVTDSLGREVSGNCHASLVIDASNCP